MITQQRLKELLHYDPDTGKWTWIVSTSKSVHIGDIAGGIRDGYRRIKIDGIQYAAYRLAFLYMLGKWPKHQVDHINRVTFDNRWINLREATHAENGQNRSVHKNNTSGYTGIYWREDRRKWRATIMVDHKPIHIGYYSSKEEAIIARKEAKEKFHPFYKDK